MTWEEIVEISNITDYISQFTEFERIGNELWGLSPFKDEKTPSFSIDEEKQIFYDFSSSKGGNIITFIMEYHKCDFPQALKILQEFYNIKDNIEYISPPEIIKTLKNFKPKIKKKKEFSRKILPMNIMDKYDKRKILLWEHEGINHDIMDKYQVRYDVEKDSIVFPVWDCDGKIINIKARDTTGLAPRKYIHYYKLGTYDYFYGYYQNKDYIKKSRVAIILESEKSVMKLETWGIKNSLAMCNGKLTDEQLYLLINLGVDVIFAFDKDKSEQEIRTSENIKKLKRFCKVHYIIDKKNLLDEKDAPCDKGKDVFKMLYKERRKL